MDVSRLGPPLSPVVKRATYGHAAVARRVRQGMFDTNVMPGQAVRELSPDTLCSKRA